MTTAGTERNILTKSYPKAGAPVNKQAQPSGTSSGTSAAPSFDRTASRDTVTFEPYFWEAYNQIAEPHRFDHYLIRRWLAPLGPLGFAILKTLRDRCFHNPRTGVLRNEIEVDMDELAATIGVHRTTLFRELNRNEALAKFVRREPRFRMVNGHPEQVKNLYKVCMDTPIHPDDMEEYDLLRTNREIDRQQQEAEGPRPKKRLQQEPSAAEALESQFATQAKKGRSGLGSQIATQGGDDAALESQFATPYLQSQNATPDTTYLPSQIATPIDNLLSEGLTKESLTPSAGSPPINPPRGTEDADPLKPVWETALALLATLVNTPTLNAHLKPMRLVSVDGDTATLSAPSAFSRNWIEGRNKAEVEAALGEALGRSITVQFTTGGK